jgi:hypothetical protein
VIVQLVFFDEHLIGSSGGVDSTITEDKIRTRIEMKGYFCDIPLKHKKNMVENFETLIYL